MVHILINLSTNEIFLDRIGGGSQLHYVRFTTRNFLEMSMIFLQSLSMDGEDISQAKVYASGT